MVKLSNLTTLNEDPTMMKKDNEKEKNMTAMKEEIFSHMSEIEREMIKNMTTMENEELESITVITEDKEDMNKTDNSSVIMDTKALMDNMTKEEKEEVM